MAKITKTKGFITTVIVEDERTSITIELDIPAQKVSYTVYDSIIGTSLEVTKLEDAINLYNDPEKLKEDIPADCVPK